MRSVKIFIAVFCLAVAATVAMAFMDIKAIKKVKAADKDKGFAVIELFTSEGCSSCPPADELVARVQKEVNDQPVYILAFHVDYWDRFGWKDAFSSATYTQRQQQYAKWLNVSSVYTPQIVVNGHTEFVGSEENSLRNAIKTGLQKPAKTPLELTDIKVSDNKASLKYHVDGSANNTVLLIALIEKNATTTVQSGENGGRTLSHVQIVTQLQSVTLKGNDTGTETITLPHGFNADKWELIGFVQNTSSGKILGAAKTGFSSATADGAK